MKDDSATELMFAMAKYTPEDIIIRDLNTRCEAFKKNPTPETRDDVRKMSLMLTLKTMLADDTIEQAMEKLHRVKVAYEASGKS